MNYKATLQPFIKNQNEKTGAIRTVSTGVQKLNQALDSPEDYAAERQGVEEALQELFPGAST